MLEGKKVNWGKKQEIAVATAETKKSGTTVKVSKLIDKLEEFLALSEIAYENKPTSELYGVITSTRINLAELNRLN